MKKIETLLSTFLLITGLSIIFVWIMLISTGQAPDMREQMISFIFHWLSELGLAIISIYTAVLLFRKKLMVKLLVFFNLGLLVCSTFNASWYYATIQPELPMFLFVLSFFLLGVLFTLGSFRQYYIIGMSKGQSRGFNFAYLFFGILIYYMLNLAGIHFQNRELGAFIIDLFFIVLPVYFVIKGLQKTNISLGFKL